MNFVYFFVLYGVLATTYHAQEVPEYELKFVSSPTIFKVYENSTIYLPCALNYMNNASTVWYRNREKIADSHENFSEMPINIELAYNHSLKINNVKRIDSGEYSCEITESTYQMPMKQNHIVNVLYSPVIYPDPNTGGVDVELGHSFILICDVIGNPRPKLKWYFQNREILLENEHMVMFNISRTKKDHAGEYQCVADNNVGRPARAIFSVRILYPPEVSIDRPKVHSAIGIRTELICTVNAEPLPKVDWFHGETLMQASLKVGSRVIGDKYFLTVRNMRFNDFGNYTCQATNFLGRSFQTVHVTGLANLAVFKPALRTRTESSYMLIWEVDSYSPIIQCNLRFRKQQRGDVDGRWIELIIPAGCSFMGPIHSETYTITGLEAATIYEATVSCKNEFGWNEQSNIFRFSTIGTDMDDEYLVGDKTFNPINKMLATDASEKGSTTVSNIEDPLWLTDGSTKCMMKVSLAVLLLTIFNLLKN